MKHLCVICVVGLTPQLCDHATAISSLGRPKAWRSPIPAVTATSQATLLTGLAPREHGIVANGWLDRETREIRFWQQSNALVHGRRFYEGVQTAKLFWWFNQGAPVAWSATPKPHYGCDGSKVFGILDRTGCELERRLGTFPFASFWGPNAGLPSSEWIADAAALVLREKRPELTLVYLPHLDYGYQRSGPGAPRLVQEVDACARRVIDAAHAVDTQAIVISEYGLVPVARPIFPNRALRRAGWLDVRHGPFGEMLDTFESRALAVADHQITHLYVQGVDLADVRREIEALPGVAAVVAPGDIELDHRRAGDLVALAEPDAWFSYEYWFDAANAPDFARTVDIHRKPGFDPCELFMTSRLRAAARLAQKRLGFRYRMDVVPLDPARVKGSHGLRPGADAGPVIIGPGAPDDMTDFAEYVRGLLAA